MRAIGLFGGIGTMLYEARALGFQIVGNVEPRPRAKYPITPRLWEANFPEAPLYLDVEAARRDRDLGGADLALGHPPCGGHSALGRTGSHGLSSEERARRGAEQLAVFTRLVRLTKPTIFAMENLPRILDTVAPRSWWAAELPRYQLTLLTISNWDYGCVQRRVRLWVIGTRREQVGPFAFRSIRRRPVCAPRGVLEALAGLPANPSEDVPELAHVHDAPTDRPHDSYWVGSGDERRQLATVHEAARYFRRLPSNRVWRYETADGREVRKAGHLRLAPKGPARNVNGGPQLMHPLTGWPLTPRERARLMGWPDDFRLWDGETPWTRALRRNLAPLTGRGVPSEFVRYLLPQLRDHLEASSG